ncbi:glycoside hydrolase family 31 protein [Ileibacterium valens]|uniref:glycoside hydrolase family 31 protein n=1 Tax=Ileibacterium valens TaxID=1862668 RepID=UPI0027297791|nr:TIM-barrel domain-containing protein [Ileibacterium valens]
MKKYIFGQPIETQAAVLELPAEQNPVPIGTIHTDENHWKMSIPLNQKDVVYGLGQTVRGINKRGWTYTSWASDDPEHSEDRHSLYGAHNFIIVDPVEDPEAKPFGLFIDNPGKVVFDIGDTKRNEIQIQSAPDLNLYLIEGNTSYEISQKFRKLIGQSYIAPKFAFGYGQSRWGYKTKDDFRDVLSNLKTIDVPVDMIYMDIDYMERFKDFTVNNQEFGNHFKEFVDEMKKEKIHLVPIIDAGVKVENGYSIYEEGKEKNYFCKMDDHTSDFIGAVWPGYSVFPDFLNHEASQWFGMNYKMMTDAGIDAFWNDMNEPALFYSETGMKNLKNYLAEFAADPELPRDCYDTFHLNDQVNSIKNSMKDYESFYHHMGDQWVSHDKVHNLYGYKMTQSASDAFKKLRPNERTLMYSRSSYIGAHRYGGIWTGDNKSWWSHLPLILHQLPALNMCGFLYTGCDLGGFGADATRDLVLRFMQIGIFTPLMRNHSALGTRDQEPYRFENPEDFSFLVKTRYRLIPYLYSEYMKAVQNNDLMFRPLSFDFPDDEIAREVEDQLLIGHEMMIAPVTEQNKTGRMVYLPEEMIQIRIKPTCQEVGRIILGEGWHYIQYPENQVIFFVRKDKTLPLVHIPAKRVDEIDYDNLEMVGYMDSEYELYDDDGISSDLDHCNASITIHKS